jgi:hypothetical protein
MKFIFMWESCIVKYPTSVKYVFDYVYISFWTLYFVVPFLEITT